VEQISQETGDVKRGSDRGFGITFAVVFGLLGGYFTVLTPSAAGPWLIGSAGAFLVVAFVRPAILRPLNIVWFQFGLFFLVITPFAIVMKLAGRDHLCLKFDSEQKSYWVKREVPGPSPESFKKQF
jgi:hypothetical protein